MDKKTLNRKIGAVKKKIKANSKDAHFADTLIDELLSLKGQAGVEPTLVHIPVADVVKTFKGDTFEMSLTKHGDVVYHVFGGYTLIADGQRMRSLANTLTEYITHEEIEKELTDEEKEAFFNDMEATTHVLNIPMIAFGDIDLKYELATVVVRYLRELYQAALDADLQEETREQDVAFEDATKALEELKASVKEE